jgi:hypothetical protein
LYTIDREGRTPQNLTFITDVYRHYDLVHRHAHGWDTRIRTRSAIACTATHYIIEADLEAFEAEHRVFSRSWTRKIERDLC